MKKKANDEFLKELWQKSEDLSYLNVLDASETKIKNEVISQLINMMDSVEAPKEGENTSNLYRILVKRLRNQISNFDKDPEVVDVTSKKLAKWVEEVVKEAYYRKHGKIPPTPATTAARDTLKELTRKVQKEIDNSNSYFKPESNVQVINVKKRIERPKSVIIDGEVYVLKPTKLSFSKDNRKGTIQVKYKEKNEKDYKLSNSQQDPSQGSLKGALVKSDLGGEIVSYNVLSDSSFFLTPFGFTGKSGKVLEEKRVKDLKETEGKTKDILKEITKDELKKMANPEESLKEILKGKMQEFSKISIKHIENLKEMIIDSKHKDNESYKNSRDASITEENTKESLKDKSKINKNEKKQQKSIIKCESLMDNDSTNPLVRNWCSWMSDLTKKAKNLVKWEESNVIESEISSAKYIQGPKEKSDKELLKKISNSPVKSKKKKALSVSRENTKISLKSRENTKTSLKSRESTKTSLKSSTSKESAKGSVTRSTSKESAKESVKIKASSENIKTLRPAPSKDIKITTSKLDIKCRDEK